MRIGVVSDTHRNTGLLIEVVGWMMREQRISMLYHLGDDYEDVGALADTFLEVVQVPGIYHPGYADGSIPAKVFETVQGVRVLLLHSMEKDLDEADRDSADIVLYGHTHKASIEVEDGKLFFNPGHLKNEMDKHEQASFGVLDIGEKKVHASIFNLEHDIVDRVELVRSENGLYRAS